MTISTMMPTVTPTTSASPSGPTQTATVQYSISIPNLAVVTDAKRRRHYASPLTRSIEILQNGTTVADVTVGSTGCVASGTATVCSGSFVAPVGSEQTFQIETFAYPQVALSAQSVVLTIVAGQNLLPMVLGGIPAALEVAIPSPLQMGVSGTTAVYVSALDAYGETIVGPGNYSDVNGNPLVISLRNLDETGHLTLNASSITAPSQPVTLSYDGGMAYQTSIVASSPNVTSKQTNVFACSAAGAKNEFLAIVGNGIARFPLAGSGTAMTSEAELIGPTAPFGITTFATDGAGNIYALVNAAPTAISEFCANATGEAFPIEQFAFANTPTVVGSVPARIDGFTVDSLGDRFVALTQFTQSQPKFYPTIVEGYGSQNQQIVPPTNVADQSNGQATAFSSLAADPNTLYVGRTLDVVKVGTTNSPASRSGFVQPETGFIVPTNSTVDSSGNVYVLYYSLRNLGFYGAAGFMNSAQVGVVEYDPSGNVVRTIAGDRTGIVPGGIAVDGSGTIYVSGSTSGAPGPIELFGTSQTGNVAPQGSIAAISGEIVGVDSAGNVYADNAGSVYAYTASGVLARQLTVPGTSVAVAPSGEIVSASGGQVYVVPSGATSGTSAVAITAAVPQVGSGGSGSALTVGIDPTSNEIVVDNFGDIGFYNAAGSTRERTFTDPNASQTDYGPETTIAVDDDGAVYTIAGDIVYEYAAGSSGAVAPVNGFSDFALSSIETALGVDVSTSDVLVASCVPAAVGIFAPGLNGMPLRIISGWKTGLQQCPGTPSMDANGSLYVPSGGRILEFAPNANGNVAPIATMAASSGGVGFASEVRGRQSVQSRKTAFVRAYYAAAACGFGRVRHRGVRASDCGAKSRSYQMLAGPMSNS